MDKSKSIQQPTKQINKMSYHFENGHFQRKAKKDIVIIEQPLLIRLTWFDNNIIINKVFSITMRTPGHDYFLILGLLYSENVIKQLSDIESVTIESNDIVGEGEQNEWLVKFCRGYIPDLSSLEQYMLSYSSCGLCGTTSLKSLKLKKKVDENYSLDRSILSAESILSLADAMRFQQSLFNHTGGVHGAALFNVKLNLLYMYEDIGRHNAVDKVIGAFISKAPTATQKTCELTYSSAKFSILLVSGRISFEIVQKVIMAGVPVLVGVGAPSGLAIQAAKQFDLTLIGFASSSGFNVYHGDWRLYS